MTHSRGPLHTLQLFLRRWVYIILLLLVASAAGIVWLRPHRHVYGGPPVLTTMLPPYTQRQVTLKKGPATLQAILDTLAAQAGVKIEAVWSDNAKFTPDTNIMIDGDETMSFLDALGLVRVKAWGENTGGVRYELQKDRLLVGPGEVLEPALPVDVRVYPVGDFLRDDSDWITATTNRGKIDRLSTLIKQVVATDAWRDNGGTIGTIDELNDKLVIRATPGMHEQIEGLLTALRAK